METFNIEVVPPAIKTKPVSFKEMLQTPGLYIIAENNKIRLDRFIWIRSFRRLRRFYISKEEVGGSIETLDEEVWDDPMYTFIKVDLENYNLSFNLNLKLNREFLGGMYNLDVLDKNIGI